MWEVTKGMWVASKITLMQGSQTQCSEAGRKPESRNRLGRDPHKLEHPHPEQGRSYLRLAVMAYGSQ